ncbi:hypothetical protein [Enterococcus pallens]|uniref:Uncharacterized protein n=1 Tax=Enterococcus pallens ATCC BAA-351 TaxID=1158607 RepID=R2PTU7_9ENTE|nr:hypothetical protein [Enterococcus pallens]EOH87977.1 hypothetical protein UAU_04832 [Enterococcus pallens ATCC BAA-351]EOU18191.1 hypothetical protein I588_03180 [Enterococcus pallens ATCC BAA-351]OJG82188.1 hypothetical protein RV10_GL000009 [Enterococcus pallens]
MNTERFVSQMIQLSQQKEELFAHYLLAQDNLYRKIPEEQRNSLITKAMASGEAAAQQLQGQALADFLVESGIGVTYVEETSSKTKVSYTLAEIRLPDRITLNRTLIDSGQQLIDQQTGLQFLIERASISDVLTAHELFHYLENRDQLYTTEKHVQYKIGPFSKTARIHALSEIAATAFAKAFFGLSFSPLLFNPVLLYNFDGEFSEGFIEQLLKQGK